MGNNSDGQSRARPHVLREYALIADGERGALIGPRGDPSVDVRTPVGLRCGVLLAVGRVGELFGQPGRAVRVGRLLRAFQPDLAIPVDHRDRYRRMPRRTRFSRRPPACGDPAPDHRCSRRCPRTGGDGPRCGLRSTQDAPHPTCRCRLVGGPQRRPANTLSGTTSDLLHPDNGHQRTDRDDRRRRGRPPRPRPGTDRPLAEQGPPDAGLAWAATESAWREAVARAAAVARPARHAALLRGAARADQLRWRHGRCRDDEPARTGRTGPQLRLPLRLDP